MWCRASPKYAIQHVCLKLYRDWCCLITKKIDSCMCLRHLNAALLPRPPSFHKNQFTSSTGGHSSFSFVQTSTPRKWPPSFFVTVNHDMPIWWANHLCRWEHGSVLMMKQIKDYQENCNSLPLEMSTRVIMKLSCKKMGENTKGLRPCL